LALALRDHLRASRLRGKGRLPLFSIGDTSMTAADIKSMIARRKRQAA